MWLVVDTVFHENVTGLDQTATRAVLTKVGTFDVHPRLPVHVRKQRKPADVCRWVTEIEGCKLGILVVARTLKPL
jgi:hypothetical protein